MTTGALIFWLGSWTFVLGLTAWSFSRVLGAQAKRTSTPDPADDLSRNPVPPTA